MKLDVFRTEKKYEIAFVVAEKLKRDLSLTMISDPNSSNGGYRVRSLYFDSLHDDDYADKLSGLEARKKIRLRLYDTDSPTVKLELKEKIGQNQHKRSLRVSRKMACELINGKYNCLRAIEGDFAKELYCIMQLGLYRPKVIVEYKRHAFTAIGNDTRITVDSQISATEASNHFFQKNLMLYPVTRQTVLEVKYNGVLFDYVKDIINMVDKTETAVSKYCIARQISYL